MAFSAGVEMLNMMARRARQKQLGLAQEQSK